MTQKEVTEAMYSLIPHAGRISIETIGGKIFMIFKSSNENKYMVIYTIESSDESVNSDVLNSIEECNDWIEVNK